MSTCGKCGWVAACPKCGHSSDEPWRGGRLAVAFAVGLTVYLLVGDAWAQGTDAGPTSIVMSPPAAANNPWGTLGDATWPVAAYGVVHRFLSVLERMVTDTRSWLDRWLDTTKGRIKVDFRKTIVTAYGENDPDRTGPIPRHNRRRDDPDRNGADEEPQ